MPISKWYIIMAKNILNHTHCITLMKVSNLIPSVTVPYHQKSLSRTLGRVLNLYTYKQMVCNYDKKCLKSYLLHSPSENPAWTHDGQS